MLSQGYCVYNILFKAREDSKLPDNQEHEKEVAAKLVFVQAIQECPNPWFSGKKKKRKKTFPAIMKVKRKKDLKQHWNYSVLQITSGLRSRSLVQTVRTLCTEHLIIRFNGENMLELADSTPKQHSWRQHHFFPVINVSITIIMTKGFKQTALTLAPDIQNHATLRWIDPWTSILQTAKESENNLQVKYTP